MTVIRLSNFCDFRVGDILHLSRSTGGDEFQELYVILNIKNNNTLTVGLLDKFFQLESQFNNVLFKMWER